MTHRYDDIIDLPHPTSKKHPRMSRSDRAAQFSPFAALTGYEGAVRETARRTEARIELEEDELAALDEKLRLALAWADDPPLVSITYFQPDRRKAGGAYVTVQGRIQKLDTRRRTLTLQDGRTIPADEIIALDSAIFHVTDEPAAFSGAYENEPE